MDNTHGRSRLSGLGEAVITQTIQNVLSGLVTKCAERFMHASKSPAMQSNRNAS